MKNIPVLFENEFCMALDKPAGLAVQGGKGIDVSLDSILEKSFSYRPLLVHRLDMDTSGVILVAKTRYAAGAFSQILASKNKGAVKQYIAVVPGAPVPSRGVIKLDLDIRGRVQKSETSYLVRSTSFIQLDDSNEDPALRNGQFVFSVLELELGTGRMHQIRRHLRHINHPVLGDDKYGDFPLNRRLRKAVGLKRLLLHAFRLILEPCQMLPQGLDIRAELPEYFSRYSC